MLPPGEYTADFILTEDSFHGVDGALSGGWAAAMGKEGTFVLVPEPGTWALLALGAWGPMWLAVRRGRKRSR